MSDIRQDIEKIKNLLSKKVTCDCQNPGSGGGSNIDLTLTNQLLNNIDSLTQSILFNSDLLNNQITQQNTQKVINKGFTYTFIDDQYNGSNIAQLINDNYTNIDLNKIKSISISSDSPTLQLNVDDCASNLTFKKSGSSYKWNNAYNGTMGLTDSNSNGVNIRHTLEAMVIVLAESVPNGDITIWFEMTTDIKPVNNNPQ
jgi:hypothetical protein